MTAPKSPSPGEFQVDITGEIESASFANPVRSTWLTYSIIPLNMNEWTVVSGDPSGTSPKSSPSGCEVVWNVPINCSFSTPSPEGWPRVALTVYSSDWWNRAVLLGYGSTIIPTQPGRHSRTIHLFAPQSSSWYSAILGWILGRRARFLDSSKAMCSNETGKEHLRVTSIGSSIELNLNVALRNTDSMRFVFE